MGENYRPALELAEKAVRSLAPRLVEERSGAEVVTLSGEPRYLVRMFGTEYLVPVGSARVLNAASGSEAGVSTSLVVLHYLAAAGGAPIRREWIPFRSLPGGAIYEQAFRRQCIDPIVSAFGPDPGALESSARRLGGIRATLGEISFVFDALPRIPMACVLWLPDEEQKAEAKILYDAVAPDYLPTEDLAALGRSLAFGLVKAAGER